MDADFDDMRREGITAVSKGGCLYILDRTSGAPLTLVGETQDAIQTMAAAQPMSRALQQP